MIKVQLVSAPTDEGKIPLYEDRIFAPLGLIWIGTYLKERQYDSEEYDVEILDGQHLDLKTIESRLDAPVVGISFNIFSTKSLDKIAQAAKRKGATVVVGGQAATPLSRELLANHNIDYVVRHDGGNALRLIAEEVTRGYSPESLYYSSIYNSSFRKGNKIVENEILYQTHLPGLPPINWHLDGIITADYWDMFQEVLKSVPNNHKHRRPLSSVTKLGCPMRQDDKGCSFCSRIDTSLRSRTPQQAYDEFRYLVRLGADRIEEFSDSWFYDKIWLKELAEIVQMKGHWGAPIRVYADTRHINPEVIQLAQIIGIDGVILGVESGNEDILRANGKPNTLNQILYCAELLGKAGIKASPSYVLGLIGETPETVGDTFRIADEIGNRCEIEMSYFSIMTPFPGSKAWRMLVSDLEMREKHKGYHLDNEMLQKDFIERFTSLGERGADYLLRKLKERFHKGGLAQRDY